MTLDDFAAVLVGTGMPVFHEVAPDTPGDRFLVWQEYYARRQHGGVLLTRMIQADFYTKTELDPELDRLLGRLDRAGVFFEEPETGYERETGYTRHMIECEIIDTTKERE